MYECHVTIDPVFDDQLVIAQALAKRYNFKVASLLMKKRNSSTLERSDKDTFMTGHDSEYEIMKQRMSSLVQDMIHHEFIVRRYKIELIMVDSRVNDVCNLLA